MMVNGPVDGGGGGGGGENTRFLMRPRLDCGLKFIRTGPAPAR